MKNNIKSKRLFGPKVNDTLLLAQLVEESPFLFWEAECLGDEILNFGKNIKIKKEEKNNLISALFLNNATELDFLLKEEPQPIINSFPNYIKSYFDRKSWENYFSTKKPSQYHTQVVEPFLLQAGKYGLGSLGILSALYSIIYLKNLNIDSSILIKELKSQILNLQELIEQYLFKIAVLEKNMLTIENASKKLAICEKMNKMLMEKKDAVTDLLRNCIYKPDTSLLDILYKYADLECTFNKCLSAENQELVTKIIMANKELPLLMPPVVPLP